MSSTVMSLTESSTNRTDLVNAEGKIVAYKEYERGKKAECQPFAFFSRQSLENERQQKKTPENGCSLN